MLRFLSITFFVFISISNLTAQEWVNCTNGDYITDLLKTTDNTLWAATQGGLMHCRADCEEKHFFNRGNSNIPSNHITSMVEDNEGRIWVSSGTFYDRTTGTAFYDGESWTRFDTIGGVLGKAPNGDIIIASYYRIYRYDGSEFTFTPIPTDEHSFCAIPTGLVISEDGDIWISSYDYGCHSLLRYDGDQFQFYNAENSPLNYDASISNSLLVDHSGKIWIGQWNGLSSFDGENWVTYTYENSSIPVGMVTSIQEDEDGDIWVGLNQYWSEDEDISSLAKFDGQSWEAYSLPVENFNSKKVVSLLITEFALVVGTENGLLLYDLDTLERIPTSNSKLKSNRIGQILQQGDYTWITSGNSGDQNNKQLIRIQGEDWTEFSAENSPFEESSYSYRLLDIDQSGNVYAQKDPSSIYYYNGTTWNPFIIPDLVTDVNEAQSRLKFDANNQPWLFNVSGDIFRKNGSNWQVIPASEHGNTSGNYRGIVFNPENNDLWFGSYSGLFHFNGISWHTYSPTGLFQGYVLDITIDALGNIWLVGVNGVSRFDGNSFTTYLYNDLGLEDANGGFSSIKIDQEGHIWVGGNHFLLEYDGLTWTIYNIYELGVPNSAIKVISEDANHNLWLGTTGAGFTIFNKNGIEGGGIHTAAKEAPKKQALEIFPTLSPKNGILHIKMPETEIGQQAQIRIYNSAGTMVFHSQYPTLPASIFINLSSTNIAQGMYFVRLQSSEGAFLGRIVVF